MDDPTMLIDRSGLTPTPGAEPAVDVVGMLRQVSAALDSVWRAALASRAGDSAIRLGEASHGVHRALIALTSGEAPDIRPVAAAMTA